MKSDMADLKLFLKRAAFAVFLMAGLPALADMEVLDSDPHYGPAGFFDMHVCNWPDKGLFYMAVFSSIRHAEISQVELFDAAGLRLGELDLGRYRESAKVKNKRIYMAHLPLPARLTDGWFTARIHFRDGSTLEGRDYLVHGVMPFATGLEPADQATFSELPAEFRWTPPPGSTHWIVTIRDTWDNDAVIYTSPVLDKPVLHPPEGLLQKGGSYSWLVHSRDVNGNILLGDFNHGSLSKVANFQWTD